MVTCVALEKLGNMGICVSREQEQEGNCRQVLAALGSSTPLEVLVDVVRACTLHSRHVENCAQIEEHTLE